MVFAMQVSRSGTLSAGLNAGSAATGSNQASSLRYWHHDHLGSLAVVSNDTGSVIERLAFDPWGKRRNPNGQADTLDSLVDQTTDRGYTEHEHLDEMGIIHMNGRVYDPLVGRMMSADPYIQAPYNLKTFNRYAYVWSNPLKLYDPDGFNAQDTVTGSFVGTTSPSSPPSSSTPRPAAPANCGGSCNAAPIPTDPPDTGPKAPAAEPPPTGFWGWLGNKLSWFDNNVANPLIAVPLIGAAAKAPKAAFTVAEETVTLYRAVSKAELADIAANGVRVVEGGYESGKLFAINLADAAKFGQNNFKFDSLESYIVKVEVPKSVMDAAHSFTADGMKAVSIAENQLSALKATFINYYPWTKK